MARATGDTYESGRRETVDLSGGASKQPGGGHLGSYIGLGIVGVILIAMLFLQDAAGAIF
jgi:hypothetical protein